MSPDDDVHRRIKVTTFSGAVITGVDHGMDSYLNPSRLAVYCRNVGGQLVPLSRIKVAQLLRPSAKDTD